MIDWMPTPESSRTDAIAYVVEEELILARFPGGTEWQYEGCPPDVWEEFADPATSKGTYIHERLNYHAHGPFVR